MERKIANSRVRPEPLGILKSIFRVCSLKDRNWQPIREPSALPEALPDITKSLRPPFWGTHECGNCRLDPLHATEMPQ